MFVPYFDTPAGGNHRGVFVLDDRGTTLGALVGQCDYVLGMVGTDLIGVQYIDGGGQRIVAIDLSSLFI